jgi:hypothetical protein
VRQVENMNPFQYGEFYDVPRTIAIRYQANLFLLQSAFDEGADEYPDNYDVYRLPESVTRDLSQNSWKFIEDLKLLPIGRIPIEKVQFDPTRRKELDASILDQFTAGG